jgi:actin-like ATPase involved in cell morphogenesis
VIGIDFGTTNSCAAFDDAFGGVSAVSARPVNTPPYDAIIATAVLDPLATSPLIGVEAQERAWFLGKDQRPPFLNSFKPLMDYLRLRERRYLPVSEKLVYDPVGQGDRAVTRYEWIDVGGVEFSREQIIGGAAAITSQLILSGRTQGANDERVLLGLPITFSSRSRKRMIAALHSSGLLGGYRDLLQRVRFVREPVAAAAAAAYEGYDFADRELVLVFDHGGGTLDLCLIEFQRIPGFDFPMPVRELAAGGDADVAGRAMDRAIIRELRFDPEVAHALETLDERELEERVKAAKERLSTRESYEIITESGDIDVTRPLLARAIRPVLATISQELERVCEVAGVSPGDIDRVLMTGGSSLMPSVQDTVASFFPHLDEYHLRRYDPADDGDIELAITEVAQGLVRVALDDTIEQVVHWDVELSTSERPEFVTIAPRGTAYERGDDGEPELVVRHPIDDANRDGMSFGLYEHQLDHDFVFGLAEVPPQHRPTELEIRLRPNEIFPRLRLLDQEGSVLPRSGRSTGTAAEIQIEADLLALDEEDLDEFFNKDVEYLPDERFEKFTHAPLSRRLKVDDVIEWTVSNDRGGLLRLRGTIFRVVRRDDYADIGEMDSWDLREFEFHVKSPGAVSYRVRPNHGYVRLAPKQQ